MGKGSRPSRAKRKKIMLKAKAAEAARAAARAVRNADAPEQGRAVPEQLTDITALRVSPRDVQKAGVSTELMRWCIGRAAPMAERKVLEALRDRRITAYVPMSRFYRRIHGVRRLVERPLLVGYVFIGLAAHQSVYDLSLIDGIEGTLQSDGATAWVSPWAVLQIAAMEAAGQFDHTVKGKTFCQDQMVKVITGWATGHTAQIVEVKDGTLMVRFEGVFEGKPVPLANDYVELVEERTAA